MYASLHFPVFALNAALPGPWRFWRSRRGVYLFDTGLFPGASTWTPLSGCRWRGTCRRRRLLWRLWLLWLLWLFCFYCFCCSSSGGGTSSLTGLTVFGRFFAPGGRPLPLLVGGVSSTAAGVFSAGGISWPGSTTRIAIINLKKKKTGGRILNQNIFHKKRASS